MGKVPVNYTVSWNVRLLGRFGPFKASADHADAHMPHIPMMCIVGFRKTPLLRVRSRQVGWPHNPHIIKDCEGLPRRYQGVVDNDSRVYIINIFCVERVFRRMMLSCAEQEVIHGGVHDLGAEFR
jgi:hypothetical protein